MNLKKKYESPTLEVIKLSIQPVLQSCSNIGTNLPGLDFGCGENGEIEEDDEDSRH